MSAIFISVFLCRSTCDVISAAVIPAGVHHLPRPPQTHLPHPLAPPGTHRQELRPQGRPTGSERWVKDFQQDQEAELGQESSQEPEEGVQQPDSRAVQTEEVRRCSSPVQVSTASCHFTLKAPNWQDAFIVKAL